MGCCWWGLVWWWLIGNFEKLVECLILIGKFYVYYNNLQ